MSNSASEESPWFFPTVATLLTQLVPGALSNVNIVLAGAAVWVTHHPVLPTQYGSHPYRYDDTARVAGTRVGGVPDTGVDAAVGPHPVGLLQVAGRRVALLPVRESDDDGWIFF